MIYINQRNAQNAAIAAQRQQQQAAPVQAQAPASAGYNPAQGGGLAPGMGPTAMPTGPSLVDPGTHLQLPGAPNVQLGQQPSTQWDALQKVLASPGDVASNPAYQFLQQQGQQALERTLGANQQRFSGGAMTEAQKFGQGLAGQYFGQLTNTLGNAANIELSRYLQPAQAQAGLNLGAAQVAQGNYGLAQGDVRNLIAANQQNNLVNQNVSAQQGYQSLIPSIQNIAASLQSGGGYTPTGFPAPGYTESPPSNPSGAQLWPSTFQGQTLGNTYSGQSAMNFINQGY